MAFPWIFEENFELGTKGDFGTESDTGSLLDFPHYTELAAIPRMGLPFRGAYCMRIVCGDTNDHTLLEEDMNIADTATAWLRFYLFVHEDFAATANDIFNIFEWQNTSNVVEAALSLQITAATDLVEIGIADGIEAATFLAVVTKGEWHCIEGGFTVDVTPGSNGALTLRVDGGAVQSVGSHNQAGAITHGVLGTQNTASTTTGVLLFDQVIFDDAQVFPFDERFPRTILCTKSQHIFFGNGTIDNATLLSGDTTVDNQVKIYDTDKAVTDDASNIVVELRNTAVKEIVDPAGMPVHLRRGAYVQISGTVEAGGPRALVQIGGAVGFGSDGAIRNYARDRSA